MTTASEEILARYNRVEREVDAFGRTIGVRKLRGSQEIRVLGMTADVQAATVRALDPQSPGETMEVSLQNLLVIAASVVEIDGIPVPFARNRAELDAIYDQLDREGVAAAALAMVKLAAEDAEDEDAEGGDAMAKVAAKAKK